MMSRNRFPSCLLALAAATLLSDNAHAEWILRDVTAVDGSFSNIQPTFGYEVGDGTSRIQWGDPLAGSFASALGFQGYNAFPGFDQWWSFGGQRVTPYQSFLAGTIRFENGSVATYSSSTNLTVDLNMSAFGAEFDIDYHPLLVDDTWQISIVQTPNFGIDPIADADYIYFTNFPTLGSFHVFEGRSSSVQVFARFGSIDPVSFGDVEDFNGVVLPFVASNVPEPSAIVLWSIGLAAGCVVIKRQRRILEAKKVAKAASAE